MVVGGKEGLCLCIIVYVFNNRPCDTYSNKCALALLQIILCPDPCKDSVNNADLCLPCRDKRACLCHKNNQCYLSHICRFPCHIGTCNYHDLIVMVIKTGVIRDESLTLNYSFQYGVSPVYYLNSIILIYRWTHIIISACNFG